jgi:exodeoxyribonuclease V gamma subunit
MFARIRARGDLPPGTPGRLAFDRLLPEVERAARAAEQHRNGKRRSLEVDLPVAGVRVFGRIDDLFDDAQVVVHFSRLRGRQDLGPWVRHVFLCLASPPGTAPSTVVVGRAQDDESRVTAVRFGPIADPRSAAEGLIALYRAGTTAPLPFFASASRAFAKKFAETRDEQKARAAAVKQPDHPGTTLRDPHRDAEVDLLFRGRDPHVGWEGSSADDPASFTATALGIYLPLLRHEEDS